jgi:hypothetical protein
MLIKTPKLNNTSNNNPQRLFKVFIILLFSTTCLFILSAFVVTILSPSKQQNKIIIQDIPQHPDPILREIGLVLAEANSLSKKQSAHSKLRPIHFIYNIQCDGEFYEWQSLQALVLDHSWQRVGQTGRLTRLITGCNSFDDNNNNDQKKKIMTYGLLPQVEVHFVPGNTDKFEVPIFDDSSLTNNQHHHHPHHHEIIKIPNKKATYVQMNRPHALQYFFNHIYKGQQSINNHHHNDNDDEILIVIDPDFVFRKPLAPVEFAAIQPGLCIAGIYGLNTGSFFHWGHRVLAHQHLCKNDFTLINKDELSSSLNNNNETLCKEMIKSYSTRSLSIGVPYVMLLSDWKRVLPTWIQLIPGGFHFYDGIESDMYTFALSLVAHQFKIIPRNDFMATCMSSENSVHHLRIQFFLHLCQSYEVPEIRKLPQLLVNPAHEVISSSSRVARDRERWPSVNITHYFVFNKHWLKGFQFWQCTAPLLLPPPEEFAPDNVMLKDDDHTAWHRFVALEAIWAFNTALTEVRREITDAAATATGATTSSPPTCSSSDLAIANKGLLIMHERHSKRFDGTLNHVVNL